MYGECITDAFETESLSQDSPKLIVITNDKGAIVDIKSQPVEKFRACLLYKNVVDLLHEESHSRWSQFHSQIVTQSTETVPTTSELHVKICDPLLLGFLIDKSSSSTHLPSLPPKNGFSALAATTEPSQQSVSVRIKLMQVSSTNDEKVASNKKHDEALLVTTSCSLSPPCLDINSSNRHSRSSTPSTSGIGISTPGAQDVIEDEIVSNNPGITDLKHTAHPLYIYLIEASTVRNVNQKPGMECDPFLNTVHPSYSSSTTTNRSTTLPLQPKQSGSYSSPINRDGSKNVVEKLMNFMSQFNVEKSSSQSCNEDFTPSTNQVSIKSEPLTSFGDSSFRETRNNPPTDNDVKLSSSISPIKREFHLKDVKREKETKSSESQAITTPSSSQPLSLQHFGVKLWRVLEYLYGNGISVRRIRLDSISGSSSSNESGSLQLHVPLLSQIGSENDVKTLMQQCLVCVTTIDETPSHHKVDNPSSNTFLLSRLLHYQIHSATANSSFMKCIQQMIDPTFSTFSWEHKVFDKDADIWQAHLRKVLQTTPRDASAQKSAQGGISRGYSCKLECSQIYRVILKHSIDKERAHEPDNSNFISFFVCSYSGRLFLPPSVISRISIETQHLFGQPPSCLLHYHRILQPCERFCLTYDSPVEAFRQCAYSLRKDLSSSAESVYNVNMGQQSHGEHSAQKLPSIEELRPDCSDHSILEELFKDNTFPIICHVGKGLSEDSRRRIRDLYSSFEKNKTLIRKEECSYKGEEIHSVNSSSSDTQSSVYEDSLIQSVHSILQNALGPNLVSNTVEAYRLKQLYVGSQTNDTQSLLSSPAQSRATDEKGFNDEDNEDCLGGQTLSKLLSDPSDWISTNGSASSSDRRSHTRTSSGDCPDGMKGVHKIPPPSDSYVTSSASITAVKISNEPKEIISVCGPIRGSQMTSYSRPTTSSTPHNSYHVQKRPYSFADNNSNEYEQTIKRNCQTLMTEPVASSSHSTAPGDTTNDSLLHLLLTIPMSSNNDKTATVTQSSPNTNLGPAPTQSVDAFKEYLHKEAELYLQEEKRKQLMKISSSHANSNASSEDDYDLKSFDAVLSKPQISSIERSPQENLNWSNQHNSMKQKERLLQRQKHQTFLRQMSVSGSETLPVGASAGGGGLTSTSPTKYVLTPTCSTLNHPSSVSVTTSSSQLPAMSRLEPSSSSNPPTTMSLHITNSSILGNLSQSLREPAPNICVIVPSSESPSPFSSTSQAVQSTSFSLMNSSYPGISSETYPRHSMQQDMLDSSFDLNDTLDDLDLDSLLAPMEQSVNDVNSETTKYIGVANSYQFQAHSSESFPGPWKMPSPTVPPPNRVVVTTNSRWSTILSPVSFTQSVSGGTSNGNKLLCLTPSTHAPPHTPCNTVTQTILPSSLNKPFINMTQSPFSSSSPLLMSSNHAVMNNVGGTQTLMIGNCSAATACNNSCSVSGKGSSPSVLQELRQVLVQRYNHQQPMALANGSTISPPLQTTNLNPNNNLIQDGNFQLMALSPAVSTTTSHFRSSNSLSGPQMMSSVAFLSPPLTAPVNMNSSSSSFRSCLNSNQNHVQSAEFPNFTPRPQFSSPNCSVLQQRVYIASPITSMDNVVLKPIAGSHPDVIGRIVQVQPQKIGGNTAPQSLQSHPIAAGITNTSGTLSHQGSYPRTILSMGHSGPGPPVSPFRLPQPQASPLVVTTAYITPKSSPGSYAHSPCTGNSSLVQSINNYQPSFDNHPSQQQQQSINANRDSVSRYQSPLQQPYLAQTDAALTQPLQMSQKHTSSVPAPTKSSTEIISKDDSESLPEEITNFVLEYMSPITDYSEMGAFKPANSSSSATSKLVAEKSFQSTTSPSLVGLNRSQHRPSVPNMNMGTSVVRDFSASISPSISSSTRSDAGYLNNIGERRRATGISAPLSADRNCLVEEFSTRREGNGSILEDLLNS